MSLSIIFVLLRMVSAKNSLFIAIEGGPFLLVEMSGKLYWPYMCWISSQWHGWFLCADRELEPGASEL